MSSGGLFRLNDSSGDDEGELGADAERLLPMVRAMLVVSDTK
jgi:hypothetical protein